jgi:hypothetical protein
MEPTPTLKLHPRFTRNNSLREAIQKFPALAKQLNARYPDRFERLAGPDYVEHVEVPATLPKPDKDGAQ